MCSQRRIMREQKREDLRKAKRAGACKVEKVKKEPLMVIIKVFPKVVNITGILEDSNKVAFQRSIENKPGKVHSFLKKMEKKYEIKLYHAQDVASLEDIDPLLKNQGFDMVNPNAAGIDIGSRKHWVCVPVDRAQPNVREFGKTILVPARVFSCS